MLKYLINDSAKAFEPWHEGSESMSYFTSNEDATKMAIYDLEHRGLKKLVSFPFSSAFELTAAYLEIFQNYFNLSFSVLSQNWKRNLWCKFFEVYLLSRKVYAFFFFFWLCCMACGVLVLQSGIKPMPSALEVRGFNHWTAREVLLLFKKRVCLLLVSSSSFTEI